MGSDSFDRLPPKFCFFHCLHGNSVSTFAVALTAGLFLLTPAVGLFLRAAGVSGYLPPLIGLGLTASLYALLVYSSRQWFLGAFVALLVTTTYAANVPLVADIESYPGMIGPSLWVFQPALLVATVLGLGKGFADIDTTLPEIMLFSFVGWSLVVALVADAPRPDVAVLFTVFFVQVAIMFTLVIRAVRADIVTFRDVVGVYLATAVGHVFIGLVQFIIQSPLGFSVLGENDVYVASISAGPIVAQTGTFVSGFAAGGINSLLILTLPALVVLTLRTTGWRRVAGAVIIFSMLVVQRGTANDSARGALLVSLVLLIVGLAWLSRHSYRSALPLKNNFRSTVVGVLVGLSILLFPGSEAGRSTRPTSVGQPTPSEPTQSNGSAPVSSPPQSGSTDPLSNVSIPFFDLSNLGVRLQQYVAGIKLFRRNPVFGIGGANFKYVAESYGLPVGYRMHNLYFALLIETGLVSFVIYLGAIGVGFARGARLLLSRHADRALVLAVCCGLVGLLAAAFWGPFLDKIPRVFPFWALLGTIIGEYYRNSKSSLGECRDL